MKMPPRHQNTKFHQKEFIEISQEVENDVICEIKAVDLVNPVWEAQVISHLKLTGKTTWIFNQF